MAVVSLDHVVLVARNVPTSLSWYEQVLGAEVQDRLAWEGGEVDYPVLHFGSFKLNVHPIDAELKPCAAVPAPGSLDMCFGWDGDVESAFRHLRGYGLVVEFGPVTQEGALGRGDSVYTRDPDGNLVELICYSGDPAGRPGGQS